jgi:hypothetical protein
MSNEYGLVPGAGSRGWGTERGKGKHLPQMQEARVAKCPRASFTYRATLA